MSKLIQTLVSALLAVAAGVTHGQEQLEALKLESLKTPPSSYAKLQLPIQTWQTPQGSKVFFTPSPQLPMFDLQIVFDAGSGRDDGATGLAQLTLNMLQEGTSQRDAQQIAEGFDEVGARLATSVRRDKSIIRIRSLSAEQQRNTAVALLAEMLGQPLFAEDKLQQAKVQLINASAQRQASAFDKAVDQLFEHTYANHPYAANDARIAHTIHPLTPEDLKAFHRNALNASNALITLVGDLSTEQAREVAQQISAALPVGLALPPLQRPAAFEPEIYHLEHPGTQSSLLLAIPGIDVHHPDAPALALANLILGGPGATSRLFEALRTQRGLTYSAGSWLAQAPDSGLWVFFTQVQAKYQDATMALMQTLLHNYADEGPTEQQLADAKEQLRGSYLLDSVSNQQISQILANIGIHRLALGSRQVFIEQVQALSLDQLKVVLKKHLKLDTLVQISVGPTVEQHDLPEPASS